VGPCPAAALRLCTATRTCRTLIPPQLEAVSERIGPGLALAACWLNRRDWRNGPPGAAAGAGATGAGGCSVATAAMGDGSTGAELALVQLAPSQLTQLAAPAQLALPAALAQMKARAQQARQLHL
jgi:hypothetical protein